MGQAISLVSSVIGFATKLKRESTQDAREKKKDLVDRLINPVKPPFFYPTLKVRTMNLKPVHPYSTESMQRSIAGDVIPSGYSIEQLKDVGFDMTAYELRRTTRRTTLTADLLRSIVLLKKMLKDGMPGLDERTRQVLDRERIFNNVDVLRFLDTVEGVLNEHHAIQKIDSKTVDTLIEMLNSKVSLIQQALDLDTQTTQFQKQVSDAEQQRSDATLKVVRRALLNKF